MSLDNSKSIIPAVLDQMTLAVLRILPAMDVQNIYLGNPYFGMAVWGKVCVYVCVWGGAVKVNT